MPTYPQKPEQLKGLIKKETEAVFWAPLTLELSILGKFLADEIKKLPPEAIPPALEIVDGLIVGFMETAVVTRKGFTQVPLPKPYATLASNPTPPFYPLPNPALTTSSPVTIQWIEKQANMLQKYIPEAIFGE